MDSVDKPSTDLWKYVATIAVTVMIAGAPGIMYAVRTWNVGDDVNLIDERQDDMRQRIAVLETLVAQLRIEHSMLEERVRVLETR